MPRVRFGRKTFSITLFSKYECRFIRRKIKKVVGETDILPNGTIITKILDESWSPIEPPSMTQIISEDWSS